jgi:VIT1/CCC1 family predicted Fe2+/Mn2+ transporter
VQAAEYRDPHEFDHTHPDMQKAWLRPAVFGGLDGLVSNIALIAGVGASGARPETVVIAGVAGLVAGAFSMAIGEYVSVQTQREQLESEMAVEQAAHTRNPVGEQAELAQSFIEMGLSEKTALIAAQEVHENPTRAAKLHVTHELGLDPTTAASPIWAAVSSFVTFSAGASVPLIPYMLGFTSLWLGLASGGVGLLLAGALASRFTRRPWWLGSARQFALGALAVAATYGVGTLFGIAVG